MKVFTQASELGPAGPPVCIAIGVFDGVHRGHQAVIRRTVEEAGTGASRAAVVTFDRHPNAVLAPDRTPLLIQPRTRNLRAFADLGVEHAIVLSFDRAFSEQTGEAFLRRLARELGRLSSVSIGRGFTFGHRRSGNVDSLRRLGLELGFAVQELPPALHDGAAISSTRIREAIRHGEFSLASQMLGRAYTLCGPVVPGERLGRTLGFPTANLDTTGLVLPPSGVYAAEALRTGTAHPAVVNLGRRPTVADGEPPLRVEAHLLEFDADLYGQELELRFVARLRDERRFASLDALRTQIRQDILDARTRFAAA